MSTFKSSYPFPFPSSPSIPHPLLKKILINKNFPHLISQKRLKTLTQVKFEEDINDLTAGVGMRNCICPVCRKSLSNNVKTFVLKACGHVIWYVFRFFRTFSFFLFLSFFFFSFFFLLELMKDEKKKLMMSF
jgi:hypothetical protein